MFIKIEQLFSPDFEEKQYKTGGKNTNKGPNMKPLLQ